MSAFDRRVLQWLDTSTLTDKSKTTLLARIGVGIDTYKNLSEDTSLGLTDRNSPIRIDFALQDPVAKAIRRLQSGDCPPGTILFPQLNASALHEQERHNLTSYKFGEQVNASEEEAFAVDKFENSEGESVPEENVIDEREDMRRRLTLRTMGGRHAVSAEVVNVDEAMELEITVIPKPVEVSRRVLKSLEQHPLFCHLDDHHLHIIVDMMQCKTTHKGERILTQGQPNDTFFVIAAGSCVVPTDNNQRLHIGSCFGHVALMYDSKAPETVESAMALTQLCSITRGEYQKIATKASNEKRERYKEFLSQVKWLQGLTSQEQLQLADMLKSAKYKKGEHMIKFGEEGVWFHCILEGVVNVIGRDANGKKIEVCSFKEGDCVGELEFLFKHKTVADVVAATEIVRTGKVHAHHFEKAIGSAKEVLERQANNDEVFTYYREKRKELFGTHLPAS